MPKLTSQQREYFKERIEGQFKNSLGPLEKIAAIKKSKLTDEKFDSFIEELGIAQTLKDFTEAEKIFTSIKQTMANHMTNLQEQYDMPESDYGRKSYEWTWNSYSECTGQIRSQLMKMCRAECEIAFKSIPEGEEIEKLKTKRREAIDYIMGYDQSEELLHGLANLLQGSGVKMLEEHKA